MPSDIPPGRARLDTSPDSTGLAATTMTIGIVFVACLAPTTAMVASTTITSDFKRPSEMAARPGRRSYSDPPQLELQLQRCRPSTYPRSRRPCRNASQQEVVVVPGVAKLDGSRTPIRKTFADSACARNGAMRMIASRVMRTAMLFIESPISTPSFLRVTPKVCSIASVGINPGNVHHIRDSPPTLYGAAPRIPAFPSRLYCPLFLG